MLLIISLANFLFMSVIASLATTTTEISIPTPSTIVDILSANVQYSYFLRHLQLNGMIPIINSLENVTILAPVNSAFAALSEKKLIEEKDSWLRYIINQKFRVGYLGRNDVIFESLYNLDGKNYPIKVSANLETLEYMLDDTSAIVESDIYAKHQHSFIQGIDQLLPDRPTICKLLLDSDNTSVGNKSISFIKGIFQSIFSDEVSSRSTSKQNKQRTCSEFFNNIQTIFIPTDDYIKSSISALEERYYSALIHSKNNPKFSTTSRAVKEIQADILEMVESLVLNQLVAGVNGTDSQLYQPINQRNCYNVTLQDTTGSIVLNDIIYSSQGSSNILVSDCIIHVFDMQNGSNFFKDLGITLVEIIPRKALFALHYSSFVKEIEYRSLGYLIDGSVENQTIFLESSQKDDYFEENTGELGLMSASYKDELMYQFSSEFVNIGLFKNYSSPVHFLLDSKYCSNKRIGSCFKLKLTSLSDKNKVVVNDEVEIIGQPIIIPNNNIIYLLDDELPSPQSFKQALGGLIANGEVSNHLEMIDIDRQGCLTTIEFLKKFKLYSLDANFKGYSVFLPCAKPYSMKELDSSFRAQKRNSGAWDSLGLVSSYLESNPTLLEKVMQGFFVEDIVYSNFGIQGKNIITDRSLNGENVEIQQSYSDEYTNHIIVNNYSLSMPLNSDTLFNQGVIHIIDKVLLPEDFEVPLIELIKTTFDPNYPQISFLDIIQKFPKLTDALGIDKNSSSTFSLLIPSAESLSDFNITEIKDLYEFLNLHLIPNDQLGRLLDCVEGKENSHSLNSSMFNLISTNHSSSKLACLQKPSKTILRLKSENEVGISSYDRDHEVSIISHGCTSDTGLSNFNNNGNVSCVFLINKPIKLSWLDGPSDNFLHIHFGLLSVGMGIILGLIIFGGVLFAFVCYSGNSDVMKSIVTDSFDNQNNNFMRVTNDGDPCTYDRGYETDIDVFNDTDPLLSAQERQIRKKAYGSTNSSKVKIGPAEPRRINHKQPSRVLGRYDNLPSGV